ncbi:GLIPR1-like protein 1 [Hoplias malabaricus]|uniref:GLIPR1-like protein 1 n=1 Tax=Hoplias malabaricus TaxID=27720 RepID=UPI0034631366
MFTCGDVLVLFLLNTAMSLSSTPSISDKTFIEECVQQHNQNRSTVRPTASNMWYMTWDESLAIAARAWSRGCLLEHNTHLRKEGRVNPVFRSLGQNLWAGTHFTVKGAIKKWFDDVVHYNFDTGACKTFCGLYKQVVWADAYKVGCAAHFCPNGVKSTSFYPRPATIFICNYANGAKSGGMKPYKEGPPCSDCSGETCENNLCRNATRDEEKRYNWTPDWDTVGREFCKA